jgi:DNA-binding NarL/FixJ family response regulator
MEPGEPITVWLIEDSTTYRTTMARAIERMKGLVCPRDFCSYERAEKAFSGPDTPDVLLLDVGLPGLDGIQALERIRVLSPETKVLILTVFDDTDKIFAAICAGASGYLLKTASIVEIAECIRQAQEGGAPMHPKVARRVLDRFSVLAGQRTTSPDYNLTEREREILNLLVEGISKKQIAAELGVSIHTVTTHLRRVYEKLHVTKNAAAVAKALRERLV